MGHFFIFIFFAFLDWPCESKRLSISLSLTGSVCPQEAAMKDGCPVLSQFPEGFLGKLQIRKSGKVELKLGDVVMDVSEGAAFSFLQVL